MKLTQKDILNATGALNERIEELTKMIEDGGDHNFMLDLVEEIQSLARAKKAISESQ